MKQPYRHVLVGTDFSDYADRAVAAAERVARRFDARVTLLHVYKPGPFYRGIFSETPEQLEARVGDAATKELEAIAARRFAGASVDLRALAHRSAADAFCDEAARVHADLCIVGTHGRAGIERFFIGSVAEKIVRHAPTDVLTVPPHTEAQVPFVDRVMIATDFSDAATKAAQTAALLAPEGAELLGVHVFDDSVPVPAAGGGFESTAQSTERLGRELDDWRARVFGERAIAGEVIADGNAAMALTARAEAWKAELIVVGSHGRGGVARLLIGSVAEHTIRHAPCAVLCVR